MAGCPACRSIRLRSAPIPVIGILAAPLLPRRRYQCADCRWTGWKHRLRRRSEIQALRSHRGLEDGARATSFLIVSVLVLLVISAVLIASCGTNRPDDANTSVAVLFSRSMQRHHGT